MHCRRDQRIWRTLKIKNKPANNTSHQTAADRGSNDLIWPMLEESSVTSRQPFVLLMQDRPQQTATRLQRLLWESQFQGACVFGLNAEKKRGRRRGVENDGVDVGVRPPPHGIETAGRSNRCPLCVCVPACTWPRPRPLTSFCPPFHVATTSTQSSRDASLEGYNSPLSIRSKAVARAFLPQPSILSFSMFIFL